MTIAPTITNNSHSVGVGSESQAPYQLAHDEPGSPPKSMLEDALFHFEPPPGPEAVRLWIGDEPGPMVFRVDGLVPDGFITILFGDSGLGKSYLALQMAICVTLGIPFLGRNTIRSNVLWLDTELNEDELRQRTHQIARGMELDELPEGLFYYRPDAPISSPDVQRDVAKLVRMHEVGLIILDSLTIGAGGNDTKEQSVVVDLLKKVEKWCTCLCIDHITKNAAAGYQSRSTIYGSGFKRALARSTIRLAPAEQGALCLMHDKSNFSELQDRIELRISFSGDPRRVVVQQLAPGTVRPLENRDRPRSEEQTFSALAEIYHDKRSPVTLDELAEAADISPKTVRNHLTKLGKKVKKHGDNTYEPSTEDEERSRLSDDSLADAA